jgi:LmbE family N-acetylglucosaminyl deacetylase
MSAAASAEPPPPAHAPGALLRSVERLQTTGSVLYVAAHPDDENTRLLAWLTQHAHLRAAYLSLTRGDGGQNLVGSEQGQLLGVMRTQELLAARRVDGAEQFFTRARDFGYSKTPDETLAVWGKDAILTDVVTVIRTLKPDVIVTRFPTSGLQTHGHHTASAILAVEAYRAAADANFHPEEVKTLGVWKARRIVWNKSSFFIQPGEDLSKFISLDVGGYDPLLGLSYGELAADSRSMHKSQGFGAARARGPSLEYFQLLDGEPMKSSILDGVDVTWKRVDGAGKVSESLARAHKTFDARAPWAMLPALGDALAGLDALPATNIHVAYARTRLVELMLSTAGVSLEVLGPSELAASGSTVKATVIALNRAPVDMRLDSVLFPWTDTPQAGKPLPEGTPVTLEQTLTVPAYAGPNGSPIEPESLPTSALFLLHIAGHTVEVRRPFVYKWVDPVEGERVRRVEVSPRVTLTVPPLLIDTDGKGRTLVVRAKLHGAALDTNLGVVGPAGWTFKPTTQAIHLEKDGAETELRFEVSAPAGAFGELHFAVGDQPGRELVRVEHPHIPAQLLFIPAVTHAVHVNLMKTSKSHARRIGYIPGPGDEVAPALRAAGYAVTILDEDVLREQSLADYEAIVVGVRAFNTRPRLATLGPRLLAYVEAGGRLLVQYQTSNRISGPPPIPAPFPFTVGQDRVTNENAPVTRAATPLLSTPNNIGDADFAGWVQERGLYFATTWDKRYTTPLTMNDSNEKPTSGALLVAKHGKGTFIYTGLAFFRQLPAGVPGAFRLFANLIAAGKK